MDQGFRRAFTAAEKTELWDRWQRGESSKRSGGRLGSLHRRFISRYLHLAPLDDQGYPFSRDHGFGEPHEAWPMAASRLREIRRTAFVSDQMTHGGQKGFRHDQARPIGARDPIAPFSLPAEARGTAERSQGSLPAQGPETIRRGAIPFPEANANLTDYPRLLIAHPSGQLAKSI
jgi:hypothetical protein